MIVECCGVPGGSKSTLMRAYLEHYEGDTALVTLDMYKRLPEAGWLCLYALRHPLAFLWLCVFVVHYHARGLFLFSLHLALRAAAKYQKASWQRTPHILFLDEGLVHVLCTLPARALGSEEMDTWLARMPLPGAVCIAQEGSFHRFESGRDVVHPRVAQGEEALYAWKEAVKRNTILAGESLATRGVPLWHIPQRDASPQVLESLHTFLSRA